MAHSLFRLDQCTALRAREAQRDAAARRYPTPHHAPLFINGAACAKHEPQAVQFGREPESHLKPAQVSVQCVGKRYECYPVPYDTRDSA